ncbi:hypothetical protein CBS101457_003099 [Exobasidium rhododendri]|nr:hypothetical protein CBS101457_003099 [Exobasidium rhododendri]
MQHVNVHGASTPTTSVNIDHSVELPSPPSTAHHSTVASIPDPNKPAGKKKGRPMKPFDEEYIKRLRLRHKEAKKTGRAKAKASSEELGEDFSAMSIKELVRKRESRMEAEAAGRWSAAFNNHADVIHLDPSSLTPAEMELAFRALRGNEAVTPAFNRRMTLAMRGYLTSKNASRTYINLAYQQWKAFNSTAQHRRFLNTLTDTKSPADVQRLAAHRERLKVNKRASRKTVKQRGEEKKKKLARIVAILTESKIDLSDMEVVEMEKSIRALLDGNADSNEKINSEAIKFFVNSIRGPEDAKIVVDLRRLFRSRESSRIAQKSSFDRQRKAAAAASSTCPLLAETGCSNSCGFSSSSSRRPSSPLKGNTSIGAGVASPCASSLSSSSCDTDSLPSLSSLDEEMWWRTAYG